MSRAKLFNMIKSRGEAPQGRNTFDLSNSHAYTSKAGKITPVKALHTYPYDYFEVDLAEFSQNNIPLNTAAFLKGKKELLAYFVPYNTIWHNFNQYQATREDPDSSLLQQKGISYEPRISIYTLYSTALYFMALSWLYKEYPRLEALYTAWQMHYGFTGSSDTKEYTLSEYLQVCEDTAYHDGWHSTSIKNVETVYETSMRAVRSVIDGIDFDSDNTYLGLSFDCWESSVRGDSLKLIDTARDFNGNFIWCDWCQKMDMLGYGNIYPILKSTWEAMSRELDAVIDGNPNVIQYTNKITYSTFGYVNQGHGHTSFVDDFLIDWTADNISSFVDKFIAKALSYISNMTTYVEDEVTKFEYLNVYALYAYNKCFYDYMRNVYFDNDYVVFNYNCDFIDANSLEGSIINTSMLPLRWYHLECHQWKKDMFTGVLPDNQLGQVSSLILSSDSLSGNVSFSAQDTESAKYSVDGTTTNASRGTTINNQVAGTGALVVSANGLIDDDDDNHIQIRTPHTHKVPAFTGSASFAASNIELNVLALKRAEAIQQYRQDLMRAGNRTKDVFKQVYGVEPKSELDECPYFIEVCSNDININPIVSTASTGQENNGKLGDIAARALINPEKSLHFKFSTKDFGCILFLSYIVPESMYNSYRIDPCVTHLDQEAHGLPYFQNLGLQPVIGEFLSNLGNHSQRSRTLGYAPPYLERKTDIDLVHGNLVDCFLPALSENDSDIEYQGSMSHWVVARTDMQQEDAVSLRNFYINPRILDNVFQFNAGDDYETDHFLNFVQIKVDSSRAFSEIGLPRF